MMLSILYLLIGVVVSGANYIVTATEVPNYDFESGICAFASIMFGVFWPFTIGVVAAKWVRHTFFQ